MTKVFVGQSLPLPESLNYQNVTILIFNAKNSNIEFYRNKQKPRNIDMLLEKWEW